MSLSQRPRNLARTASVDAGGIQRSNLMGGIIYLVGLIVIVMFILSLVGLR